MTTISPRVSVQPEPASRPVGRTARVAPAVRRVGFWAAVLTTVWTLWFTAAFGVYMASLPPWSSVETFAAAFQLTPYLLWVVPCLLLALTFPVLLSAVHFATPDEAKLWSWLGLAFGVMYGAVLGATYWLMMTFVPSSLLGGYTDGLIALIAVSPHSIANALEGIGYGFMGLATLFAGLAFAGGRLERWVRWLFVANGVASSVGVFLGGLGFMPATWLALVVWCVTFPLGTALIAVLFRRQASDGER